MLTHPVLAQSLIDIFEGASSNAKSDRGLRNDRCVDSADVILVQLFISLKSQLINSDSRGFICEEAFVHFGSCVLISFD